MGILIANALNMLTSFISYVLIARIILSLFLSNGMNEAVYKIYNITVMLTEPLLAPVRTLIWKAFPSSQNLPVDFSPIALFLIIDWVIKPVIFMIFR